MSPSQRVSTLRARYRNAKKAAGDKKVDFRALMMDLLKEERVPAERMDYEMSRLARDFNAQRAQWRRSWSPRA